MIFERILRETVHTKLKMLFKINPSEFGPRMISLIVYILQLITPFEFEAFYDEESNTVNGFGFKSGFKSTKILNLIT